MQQTINNFNQIIIESNIDINDFYTVHIYNNEIIFKGHQKEANMKKYGTWLLASTDDSTGVISIIRFWNDTTIKIYLV